MDKWSDRPLGSEMSGGQCRDNFITAHSVRLLPGDDIGEGQARPGAEFCPKYAVDIPDTDQ